MRTPRTKAGVNNENNTSKCPHKPRTKPLMIICRPGVPSLLPPPSAAGQWPDTKCKISNRKGILQVCCSLPGAAVGLGEKKSPSLHPSVTSAAAPLHPKQLCGHGLLIPVLLDKGLSLLEEAVCHLLSHLIKILRHVRKSWKHLYSSQRLGSSLYKSQHFWLRWHHPTPRGMQWNWSLILSLWHSDFFM